MSPPSPARSPLAAKCENAQASPDAARAPAASTFDLGPAKPPRLRACATHHPVRKLAPSSGVEAILGGAFNAPFNDASCKTRVLEVDDETYVVDGMPLPTTSVC